MRVQSNLQKKFATYDVLKGIKYLSKRMYIVWAEFIVYCGNHPVRYYNPSGYAKKSASYVVGGLQKGQRMMEFQEKLLI